MFFSTNDDQFVTETQEFIPASSASTRSRLWPFIEATERKYIYPLLGKDLYAELQKFFNKPNEWSSGSSTEDRVKTAELLRLVQLSEINLAYYVGFDLLNAMISDMGFRRSEGENFKGLYKYQEENVRNYFKNTGFNGLDDVLAFIEENIQFFPEWEESETFAARKQAFIKDTSVFNGICDIGNSRLIFLRLQPFIQQVLDIDIKALLGTTVWDALITEMSKADTDKVYADLLAEIRKPLAFLSVALLVQNTGSLSEKGLYFEGKTAGFPDNTTLTAASGSAQEERYEYYRSTGEQYLEALRKYLKDKAFTGYSGILGNVYSRDNDHKKTFFV